MSTDELDKRPAVGAPTSEGEGATQRERYFFDPVRFDADTEEIERLRGFTVVGEDRGEQLEHDKKLRSLLKEWSMAYSGQVPREWGEVEVGSPWHKISDDLRNPDFQPNATETEAAITYPIWHIPFLLATTRPLTTDQLMLLSAMPGIAYFGNAGDILVAQKGFGVDQQVLDRAASLNRRALIKSLSL